MHHHYLLNKPHSVLSQFKHGHARRKNKRMLGELHDFAPGTMAVGRLDQMSEGLLLLTTDGRVSYEIRSESVPKEYYVRVQGVVSEQALAQLRSGVLIKVNGKDYTTLPGGAELLAEPPAFSFAPRRRQGASHGPTTWLSITLREGKNRQIRRMCAALGHPVIRLVRVRIGGIRLGQLGAGRVREVADLAAAFIED